MRHLVRQFLEHQASAAIVLIAAGIAALLMKNSPLAGFYDALLNVPVQVRVGQLDLAKPLVVWVNDGLMAVFFFLVGLEIKRELVQGALAKPSQAALPLVAAMGGMAVPAAIYAAINWADPVAIRGWAIPTATDIAFALGILMLLGDRVPAVLKVFLTALAIIDDLGAIVIIALFYTEDLSTPMVALSGAGICALVLMNRLGVRRGGAYVLVGIALWLCVLKSGVHATLAGVMAALAVPIAGDGREQASPLHAMEHALQPWVAYGVLPVFAFCNAGVALAGVTLADLAEPIPLGIGLGLVIGKTLGIFGACWLLIVSGGVAMPAGMNWKLLLGTSILGGVGFTMSLFIGTLAFEEVRPEAMTAVRLGVLSGSLVAGAVGYALLRVFTRPRGSRSGDRVS